MLVYGTISLHESNVLQEVDICRPDAGIVDAMRWPNPMV
jgi:hypothetical protein